MSILDKNTLWLKEKISETVSDLHSLTIEINHKEMISIISDLRNRLNEPFMFVIVGEVKAGKSSFINALLESGDEICKVAPNPCTDTIQQIIFGKTREEIQINQYLKKITVPSEILKDIAIVDTPGTNTIIEHHQEITERFIPASDLIIFVFEAKNPYRQSSWEFFDFIKDEWKRKIIFVLQQKDLVEENDLEININGVREHAIKKGITNPNVFAVSALDELEGRIEASGFSTIRTFINNHITGGKALILKQQNVIDTALNIHERIGNGLNDRIAQWEADKDFRADVQNSLEEQEIKSFDKSKIWIENILAGYDKVTNTTRKELSSGLSIGTVIKRSVSSIFNKSKTIEKWFSSLSSDLEKDLNLEMENKITAGVFDLADSIQNMAHIIELKLKNNETILDGSHDVFGDIAKNRSRVIDELNKLFNNFIKDTNNFSGDKLIKGSKNLSPNIATGSGIAIVGIILTAITNMAIFDVTGGILTGIGVLFAGITTTLRRRKILKDFDNTISEGRIKINEKVEDSLTAYIHQIKENIGDNFKGFDTMLENEKVIIDKLSTEHNNIKNQLNKLKNEFIISN